MNKTMETSEGKPIKVLPVGTRIRSKSHPELLGIIRQHEYHESGKLSPIPYCISWDDDPMAYRLLGWMFIYSGVDSIEVVNG